MSTQIGEDRTADPRGQELLAQEGRWASCTPKAPGGSTGPWGTPKRQGDESTAIGGVLRPWRCSGGGSRKDTRPPPPPWLCPKTGSLIHQEAQGRSRRADLHRPVLRLPYSSRTLHWGLSSPIPAPASTLPQSPFLSFAALEACTPAACVSMRKAKPTAGQGGPGWQDADP